jgi:hypothetical protein
MTQDIHLDVEKARQEGLVVSVGRRISNGKLKTVSGPRDTQDIVTDAVELRKYKEIEVKGLRGTPSMFILVETLISFPQIFYAYSKTSGLPIFLGIKRALEGLMLILGMPRTGKSTKMAEMFRAFARHGIPSFFVGCKEFDPTIVAGGKSGADAYTRFDAAGRAARGRFTYASMQPGLPTAVFNWLMQKFPDVPPSLIVANWLLAIGQDGGASDLAQRFFAGSSHQLFLKTGFKGSFKHLDASLERLKLDRDTLYSTAAARHIISQLASLEIDIPKDHPAQLDIGSLILEKAAVYYDPSYMDTAHLAVANAGLFVNAVVFAKRRVLPGRERLIALFVDECHQFPRSFLLQLVSQCASSGIRLIMSWHALGQMGDEWEQLSMAQVRVIFGALAGSKTEEHLVHLSGTKKDYTLNFGDNVGNGRNEGVTSGPGGVSVSSGVSSSQGSQFGFAERDVNVWKSSDTQSLNYNRNESVIAICPGAELAHVGASPIVCESGGLQLSSAEIEHFTQEALNETARTFSAVSDRPTTNLLPPMSAEMAEKRKHFLAVLNAAAAPKANV